MSYSIDFKKRAVAYKQEGHTFKQLREVLGIPSETYYDWKEKLENGYYQTKTKQQRRRKIDKEALKQAVAEKPAAFLLLFAGGHFFGDGFLNIADMLAGVIIAGTGTGKIRRLFPLEGNFDGVHQCQQVKPFS
jgi:hypothetical protein